MKPIPALDNEAAMLARGRRSSLTSARNDACEALRDATVRTQSMPLGECDESVADVLAAVERLQLIAGMWKLWNL